MSQSRGEHLKTARWLLKGVFVVLLYTWPCLVAAFYFAPSSEPPTPPANNYKGVEWEYVREECADGWQSGSIGTQGACSHHGGVITVYRGSNGQMLGCKRKSHPPYAHQQQEQLAAYGALRCTSSYD